ncbi:hypothetical protein BJ322DRAFT_560228 [Thelephora terrestris]|uniref:Uncharacterized protein n=1 Tax=Thelephora terrestris TaxID=56493 RepID=A0A9P6HLG9_9AGAM|nr:hypothetical protein BJ322DRAFT_560228 [Thelephora terrestris]
MRPLLNKDFRRLRWLLRQEPPKRVRDYVTREVASLGRGGVHSVILSRLRNTLRAAKMKMAHAISALCFVSRMRLRDRGGTNEIPLDRRMCKELYGFFHNAAFCGPTANRQADMLFCREEVDKWYNGSRPRVPDDVIEQKIIEGYPDLCTHVRARVERLYAFFELPPDLSLPRPPPVQSIWEMPPSATSPPRPYSAPLYHQRAPGFR